LGAARGGRREEQRGRRDRGRRPEGCTHQPVNGGLCAGSTPPTLVTPTVATATLSLPKSIGRLATTARFRVRPGRSALAATTIVADSSGRSEEHTSELQS